MKPCQALQDSIFTLRSGMELFPSTSKKPNNQCRILAFKATDYYRLFKKDGAAGANAMFKKVSTAWRSVFASDT